MERRRKLNEIKRNAQRPDENFSWIGIRFRAHRLKRHNCGKIISFDYFFHPPVKVERAFRNCTSLISSRRIWSDLLARTIALLLCSWTITKASDLSGFFFKRSCDRMIAQVTEKSVRKSLSWENVKVGDRLLETRLRLNGIYVFTLLYSGWGRLAINAAYVPLLPRSFCQSLLCPETHDYARIKLSNFNECSQVARRKFYSFPR